MPKDSLADALERLYSSSSAGETSLGRLEKNDLLFKEVVELRKKWLEKIRDNCDLSQLSYLKTLRRDLNLLMPV